MPRWGAQRDAGELDLLAMDVMELDPPPGIGEDEIADLLEAEEADPEPRSEVQNTIRAMLEEAIQYYEENLEPDQVKATDYYHGRPFGDEEEGRSKVVSTEVRDAVRARLPSLMRIFFGPEDAVEFRPEGPEDVELARQMTDYVNFVIREDNPGFIEFYAALKDAEVRRLGAWKWWAEESKRIRSRELTGVSEEQYLALLMDGDVDVEVLAVREEEIPAPEPLLGGLEGPAPEQPGAVPPASAVIEVYDLRVTRFSDDMRIRFAAVPPEEFVFTPGARRIDDAPLVAHVREVPADELRQLGVPDGEIERARGRQRALSADDLEASRQIHPGADPSLSASDTRDESQQPILYAEAYALVDADGDGIAERRLFRCVGPDYRIVNGEGVGEVVDDVPFAVITPDPEPHTIVGLSTYDLVHDLQRINSQLLRGLLDSLSEALEPTTEVVQGEVNLGDLLNPEISGIVRVKRPGMMREVRHEFLGPAILPVLDQMGEIKENRTGVSKAAAGLDADSLQSATKAAVAATLTAAQQQIELTARVYAETGVRRLYRGLLRLIVQHQDRPRMVRLRGGYVEVDPSDWDADMDVSVNVGLGYGTTEDRVAMLQDLARAQWEMMQAGSPLVGWAEIRSTLAKLTEAAGFRAVEEFWREWGPEQEQMAAMQSAGQEGGDPAAELVAVEREKVALEQQIQVQKLELERLKIMLQDDRERDKIARETELKRAEIEAKYRMQFQREAARRQVEEDRAAMDADLPAHVAAVPPAPPDPPASPAPVDPLGGAEGVPQGVPLEGGTGAIGL